MNNMEDVQLQLNGKPVWLIKSSDQDSSGSSCDQCVFDFNAPRYEPEACPLSLETNRLVCAVDDNLLQHFTDVNPSTAQDTSSSALNIQVGGEHYKQMKIQPVEYIHANNLSFLEGNVVKYITRHKTKNKAQDIRKIIHYCTLILQLEYNETYE